MRVEQMRIEQLSNDENHSVFSLFFLLSGFHANLNLCEIPNLLDTERCLCFFSTLIWLGSKVDGSRKDGLK
jgi:hypothetical protein